MLASTSALSVRVPSLSYRSQIWELFPHQLRKCFSIEDTCQVNGPLLTHLDPFSDTYIRALFLESAEQL